jgi:hypothetical protein
VIENVERLNPETELNLVADQVRGFFQRQVEVDPIGPNEGVPPERSVKAEGTSTQVNAGIEAEVVRVEIVISRKTIEGLLMPRIERLHVTD